MKGEIEDKRTEVAIQWRHHWLAARTLTQTEE